jgi:hypothetical protein
MTAKIKPEMMAEARTISRMSPIQIEVLPDTEDGEMMFCVSLSSTPFFMLSRSEWIIAGDKSKFLRFELRRMVMNHRDACDQMLAKLGSVG